MKALTFPALLGALALLLASCEKPKVAGPPGSDGQFSSAATTALAAKMRAFSADLEASQQVADPSKTSELLTRAQTLLSEARSCASSLKREELAQLSAKVEECFQSFSILAKSLSPEATGKFTSELNYTLLAMTPGSAAPKGSEGFDPSQKNPDLSRQTALPKSEFPPIVLSPPQSETVPSSPAPPPEPVSK